VFCLVALYVLFIGASMFVYYCFHVLFLVFHVLLIGVFHILLIGDSMFCLLMFPICLLVFHFLIIGVFKDICKF